MKKSLFFIFFTCLYFLCIFFFSPNVRLDVLLASKTTAVYLIRSKEKNIFPDYFGFLHSLSRSVSPIRARSECGARWLDVIELDLKTADRNRGALIRGRHRDELRTQERQKERERERERVKTPTIGIGHMSGGQCACARARSRGKRCPFPFVWFDATAG